MSPAGWTDFLEERFGRWSVPHLVRGLVAMNAASWLLNLASPGFLAILKLEPTLILQGEWWRALTFIFVPPASAHPLFFFIFLWFLWSIGESLDPLEDLVEANRLTSAVACCDVNMVSHPRCLVHVATL